MPLDDTAEDATEDGGPTRMGFERNKNGVIKLTPTQVSRKERKQQALDMYYDTVQEDDKLTSIRTLFKEHKKKQVRRRRQMEREFEESQKSHRLHATDQTFGFITQNVNGFGSTAADMTHWFQSFGEQDEHGRPDVIVLQETHVEPAEVEKFRHKFAARWGFRSGADQPILSHWAPPTDRKGGVAILIDPYGSFKQAKPYLPATWNSHFMAVRGG
ncbi:hypothetical protein PF011_g20906 [Phytophthora fragariae]|uniref:Endonuclease/exonuclease/phosphatase domain-containing protein n=1 Tax=Phytophthora fragariae TaxID=53985 RepID=A0A6A3E9T5_9STRA|nr:hypothetical protein PF009_g23118 [Phytophthora fragariae]KAE8984108.1 hypothetical protein PF011_g20906 [Phytophthora fragariae]